MKWRIPSLALEEKNNDAMLWSKPYLQIVNDLVSGHFYPCFFCVPVAQTGIFLVFKLFKQTSFLSNIIYIIWLSLNKPWIKSLLTLMTWMHWFVMGKLNLLTWFTWFLNTCSFQMAWTSCLDTIWMHCIWDNNKWSGCWTK